MIDIPCIIFAGGRSSRMGEDKALLPFSGFKTLTEFQLFRLSKIFKTVYISCKDKSKFDFKSNFLEDIQTDSVFAPTIGFITIFKELQDERIFVLSVDSPFVGEAQIVKILEQDSPHADATIARSTIGLQPMCGIYHRSLEKKFANMIKNGNHKLGFLLKSSNTTFVDFQDDTPFLNINNPDEYKQALALF